VDWKPGMNLTVKEVVKKKKGKKKGSKKDGGGDADAPVHVRLKPCPSFFRLFESTAGVGAAAHLDQLLAPEIEEVDGQDDDDEVSQWGLGVRTGGLGSAHML